MRRLRQEFIEAIQHEGVTSFKFVGETSINLTYTRRYGRAPDGQRVDAALNTASFAVYLARVLGPGLQPGDVVVLDNLPVHKADGLAELVEARGARLLYLPPYSPDFTPLEPAFSRRKTHLRTAAARTREALKTALDAALAWITADDAQNWFGHCGYHVHGLRICAKMVNKPAKNKFSCLSTAVASLVPLHTSLGQAY